MADRGAGIRLEKKEQKKSIAVNTLYTMGGLIFMNAVLQIVITPLLNRVMGAEQLGGLLYITGLIAIVCPSVGQALNTSRLVVRRNYAVTNGDYDWILLVFGAIGSGVALWMSRNSLESIPMVIGAFLLFMFTVFRYYGDVEYRLNLNYKRYFIYYLLIGLGYLAGFGVYYVTGQWVWIYLIGEGAALLFVGPEILSYISAYLSSVLSEKPVFFDSTGKRFFPYNVLSDHKYDHEYGPPCDQTGAWK